MSTTSKTNKKSSQKYVSLLQDAQWILKEQDFEVPQNKEQHSNSQRVSKTTKQVTQDSS